MKLNKSKLLKFVRKSMAELGYVEFEHPDVSSANVFVKKEGELFLTLGFTIHRFYDDAFTADFYLARTTSWALGGLDVPPENYLRPGKLMSEQERLEITVDPSCKKNPLNSDMWWNAFDAEGNYDMVSLESFTKAIRLTEGRVAKQPGIIEKIYASTRLEDRYNIVNRIIDVALAENFCKYQEFLPKADKKTLPLKWFKAAETVLRDERPVKSINAYAVKSLAGDAFRVYTMRNL